MSKSTNDGLTRSDTGCSVPIWQQWGQKVNNPKMKNSSRHCRGSEWKKLSGRYAVVVQRCVRSETTSSLVADAWQIDARFLRPWVSTTIWLCRVFTASKSVRNFWGATVSHNAPRSQHKNKNVFSSRLNRQKSVADQLWQCHLHLTYL